LAGADRTGLSVLDPASLAAAHPACQPSPSSLFNIRLSSLLLPRSRILRRSDQAGPDYASAQLLCQAWLKVLQFVAMEQELNGIQLSVIAPVYNEAPNLDPLYRQITAALDGVVDRYEILLVDDGSTDGGYEVMQALHQADPRVVVVQFRRNFGQSAAFAAGFDYAQGDFIVTLDADLQNDPADIPILLDKLAEGYDVVAGWRRDRKDHLIRRIPSFLANRLITRATGVQLHDTGCSLRAFRRDVVKSLRLYGEMHRFIPALASWIGIRLCEIPVNHRPRTHGQAKYGKFGLDRTFRVILDLMTIYFMLGYFGRPMHLFGGFGLVSGSVGVLIGLYLSGLKVVYGYRYQIGDRPLLMLSVLLVMIGVQFLAMGLLGELIVRTYYESQGKPTYHIRTVLSRDHHE